MTHCPCSPESYTLEHLGFWQYRSNLKIEENYQCLKCKKYYRITKKGELKEIVNFKGVSKNITIPRDWKPIYKDGGQKKTNNDTNIRRRQNFVNNNRNTFKRN